MEVVFSVSGRSLRDDVFSTLSSRRGGRPFSISKFVRRQSGLALGVFSFVFHAMLGSVASCVGSRAFHKCRLLTYSNSSFPLPASYVPSTSSTGPRQGIRRHLLRRGTLCSLLDRLCIAIAVRPGLRYGRHGSLLRLTSSLRGSTPVCAPGGAVVVYSHNCRKHGMYTKLVRVKCGFVVETGSPGKYNVLCNYDLGLPRKDGLTTTGVGLCYGGGYAKRCETYGSSVSYEILGLHIIVLQLTGESVRCLIAGLSERRFDGRSVTTLCHGE